MRPHFNNTRAPRAIVVPQAVATPRAIVALLRPCLTFGRLGARQNKRCFKRANMPRLRETACLLLATAFAWSADTPARAGRQPGAPRLLRFSWSDPLARRDAATRRAPDASASVSQAAFSVWSKNAPPEIFFTRTAANTSNLWRAALNADRDVEGATGAQGETDEALRQNSSNAQSEAARKPDEVSQWLSVRRKVLRARPLTRFKAPFFASNAVPTPDGRAVLCVTNALGLDGSENFGQVVPAQRRIARLDLESGRLTAVSSSDSNSYAPAIAPDGTRFAFVSDRRGPEQVFVAAMDGGDAQPIGIGTEARYVSRRPFWLDNETLVVESTRRAQTALYRFTLPPRRLFDRAPGDGQTASQPTSDPGQGRRQAGAVLLWKRGGQGVCAPSKRQLCVATETGDDFSDSSSGKKAVAVGQNPGARLYFLAGDGSTVRTVPSTEGARHPVFSPDGSALLYDAPLVVADDAADEKTFGDSEGRSSSASLEANRGLWLLPMLRVAPVARLSSIRAATKASAAKETEELEIVGTVFAAGDDAPQVQLQWGEGDEPSRWNALTLRRVPAQSTTLATWRPPAKSRGPWMLRLTVTDSDGDKAESFLPVMRPLPASTATSNKTESEIASRIVAPESGLAAPTALPKATLSNPSPSNPAPRTTGARDAAANSPRVAMPPQAAQSGASSKNPRNRTRNRRRLPVVASSQAAARTVAALPPPALSTGKIGDESVRQSDAARLGQREDDARKPLSRDAEESVPDEFSLPPFPVSSSSGPLPLPDDVFNTDNDAPTGRKTDSRRNTTDARQNLPQTVRDNDREEAKQLRTRDSRTRDSREREAAAGQEPATRNANRGESARIAVAGTPRETTPGREIALVARLFNRGENTWQSESSRPVRLLVRWQDNATRRRTRWEIKWLRDDVRPGQTLSVPFSVSTPTRPGNYTLTISLVRLNGSTYQAPPSDSRARTEQKNGASTSSEFASVAFPVVVRP